MSENEILSLRAHLYAIVIEIDAARGLKIAPDGILDPLHPICVQAENARVLVGLDPLSVTVAKCRAAAGR
jgi:hypothetical protein